MNLNDLFLHTIAFQQITIVMVYSHWLTPGPEQGIGTGTGKIGCMRLYRTFHSTQEPGPEKSRMGSKPILQDLKLNQEMICNGFF